MSAYDFQRGFCLDFAIALALYLNLKRPRFSLLTARCRRGNVLIHSYLESNGRFLDSESIPDPLDLQDLEDRMARWLALEREIEGDETATAEVRHSLTLQQSLTIAKRCGYQTSQIAQTKALDYIRLVYGSTTSQVPLA